jgi:lysophospholipase L1-like esterase
MVSWVRNAGRIMCAGDSITVGDQALTGGWRKKFFADLANTNVRFSAVGPTTSNSPGMTATAHRGISGSSTDTDWAAEAAFAPNIVIFGWGMNDLASGAVAAYIAATNTLLTNAATFRFYKPLQQTLIYPTAPAPRAAFVADYIAAQALLPAVVSRHNGDMIDVGQPALSDGVHPVDGPTGYDAMADAIYAAILRAVP